MTDTREFLEGIFNGAIPVRRRNRQTGAMENVYFTFDPETDELVEDNGYRSTASKRFSDTMAFAQATPAPTDYSRYGEDIPRDLVDRMNADQRFRRVMERYTVESEGGYNNDPNDRGGETNFGIARGTYPNEDIRNMTRERANALLYRDYWDYNGIKTLPDDLVGIVFESAVNRGGPRTIEDVHRTLGINPPGNIIGPTTHRLLSQSDHDQVRRDFANRLRNHYRNLATQDPTQRQYYQGWMNRVNRAVH